MTSLVPIIIVIAALILGNAQKADVQADFAAGVKEGIKVCLAIFPNILIMMIGITIFRKAGGIELFANLAEPILNLFGIPKETAQIVLLRPFSGSASLALCKELMETYGVDSTIGRIGAVMLGASETSIYTIGVYTGFVGMKKIRHLLFCALMADLAAFIAAVWCVRYI